MTGDEVATEVTTALADVLDASRPFVEASVGLRADLERRGYSPTAAESIAASWLIEAHRSMWARSIHPNGDRP